MYFSAQVDVGTSMFYCKSGLSVSGSGVSRSLRLAVTVGTIFELGLMLFKYEQLVVGRGQNAL